MLAGQLLEGEVVRLQAPDAFAETLVPLLQQEGSLLLLGLLRLQRSTWINP